MTIDAKLMKDHKLADKSINRILELKLDHVIFVEHLSIFFNGLVTSAKFDKDGELHKYFQEKAKQLREQLQPLLDQIEKPKWEEIMNLGDIKDRDIVEKIRDVFPLLTSTLEDISMEKLAELTKKIDKAINNKAFQDLQRIFSDGDKEKSMIWKPIVDKDYDAQEIYERIKFFKIHVAVMILCIPLSVAFNSAEKRGNNPRITSEESVKSIKECLDTAKGVDEALEAVRTEGRHGYFPVVVEKLMRQFIDEGQQDGIWKEARIIRELHNRFHWDDFLFLRWNNLADQGANWKHFQHWTMEQEGIDSVTINVSKQMYMVVRMSNEYGGFRADQLNKVNDMLEENAKKSTENGFHEIDESNLFREFSKQGLGSPWFTFGIAHMLGDTSDTNVQDLVVHASNSAKFTRRTYDTKYKEWQMWPFPNKVGHITHREYFVANV